MAEREDGRRRRVGRTPTSTQVAESLAEERSAESAPRPRSPEAPPAQDLTEDEAKRAEKLVARWFLVAFVAGVAFLVFYWIFPANGPDSASTSTKLLAVTLGIALLALGVGIVLWIQRLMPSADVVGERHPMRSNEDERQTFTAYFVDTTETTGFTKRPLLRRTLLLAAVPLGLAPLWLLRDMGPLPKKDLFTQPWRKGMRMVLAGTETSETPRLLKISDVSDFGTAVSAVPEGITEFNKLAKAALLLIRVRPDEIQDTKQGRVQAKYGHNGVCAFSKICTHAGCPISLYEQRTHNLFCPCHQSTFDMTDGANVVFGPAVRPLPQLPIGVDSEGYLVAGTDYFINGPVGPSFWERGRNRWHTS